MNYLVTYWYLRSPSWFYAACLKSIGSLENTFAVRATAKNINKPLFQDYTYQGRIIGVCIRVARILTGLFSFFLVIIGYSTLFIIWILFPLVCILSLLGSVFGIPLELGGSL